MYTVGCTAILAAQATEAKKNFNIIDNFNQNVTWIASPHPRHLPAGLQFGLNTKTEITTRLRCWKTDITRANHFSWYFKKKTENCKRYGTYLYFRRYQIKITQIIWYNTALLFCWNVFGNINKYNYVVVQ